MVLLSKIRGVEFSRRQQDAARRACRILKTDACNGLYQWPAVAIVLVVVGNSPQLKFVADIDMTFR